MLLAVFPISLVISPIWPFHCPMTVLAIFLVGSCVFPPIGPCIFSFTMKFVILKFALIFSSVYPGENAVAINKIIFPITLEVASIGELQVALAVLLAVFELANVPRAII